MANPFDQVRLRPVPSHEKVRLGDAETPDTQVPVFLPLDPIGTKENPFGDVPVPREVMTEQYGLTDEDWVRYLQELRGLEPQTQAMAITMEQDRAARQQRAASTQRVLSGQVPVGEADPQYLSAESGEAPWANRGLSSTALRDPDIMALYDTVMGARDPMHRGEVDAGELSPDIGDRLRPAAGLLGSAMTIGAPWVPHPVGKILTAASGGMLMNLDNPTRGALVEGGIEGVTQAMGRGIPATRAALRKTRPWAEKIGLLKPRPFVLRADASGGFRQQYARPIFERIFGRVGSEGEIIGGFGPFRGRRGVGETAMTVGYRLAGADALAAAKAAKHYQALSGTKSIPGAFIDWVRGIPTAVPGTTAKLKKAKEFFGEVLGRRQVALAKYQLFYPEDIFARAAARLKMQWESAKTIKTIGRGGKNIETLKPGKFTAAETQDIAGRMGQRLTPGTDATDQAKLLTEYAAQFRAKYDPQGKGVKLTVEQFDNWFHGIRARGYFPNRDFTELSNADMVLTMLYEEGVKHRKLVEKAFKAAFPKDAVKAMNQYQLARRTYHSIVDMAGVEAKTGATLARLGVRGGIGYALGRVAANTMMNMGIEVDPNTVGGISGVLGMALIGKGFGRLGYQAVTGVNMVKIFRRINQGVASQQDWQDLSDELAGGPLQNPQPALNELVPRFQDSVEVRPSPSLQGATFPTGASDTLTAPSSGLTRESMDEFFSEPLSLAGLMTPRR